MSYKTATFFNLTNCYLEDNKLYKSKDVKSDWNSIAQVTPNINTLEQGIGLEYKNTLMSTSYEFVIGFSNKDYDEIGYINDLDYYLYIKTGNLGFVKLFNNNNLLYIASNINSSYKIELINNDIFGLIIDGKLKYSFVHNFITPLKIFTMLKNNYDYGFTFNVNLDNIPEIKVVNVTPSLENKINIFNTFYIQFDNSLLDTSVTKDNVLLRDYNSKEVFQDYSVSLLSDKRTIKINALNTPLEYSTVYEIFIPKNTLKSTTNISNDNISYTWTTIDKYEQPIEETLGFSNNPNDIYYKMRNIYNLLDIDWVNEKGDDFNFYYKPTTYNPILDKYEVDYSQPYINHNIKENTLNILQYEYLFEFDKYFETVKKYSTDTDFLDKLKSLLLKNIVNINYFKGNRHQIEFILKVYAQLLNYTMVWVNPDPFLRFKYRVSTDVPQSNWIRDVRKIPHPEGFYDKYIKIPYQIPNYLDNPNDKTKVLSKYTVTNVYITYVDFNLMKNNPEENIYYVILPNKNTSNAIWNELLSPNRFPFKVNKYNSPLNLNNPEFHREMITKQNKVVYQIKHFVKDNPICKLNYTKYYYGIQYHYKFYLQNVKQFSKLQPFLDFEIKTNKKPLTLWIDFLHKDYKYPVKYELLPFIHTRWTGEQFYYSNSFQSMNNTNIIVGNDIVLNNFRQPYKYKFTYLDNHYNLNYPEDLTPTVENDTIQAGLGLNYVFEFYKDNKKYHEVKTSLNKIEFNKTNWEKVELSFERDSYQSQKISL